MRELTPFGTFRPIDEELIDGVLNLLTEAYSYAPERLKPEVGVKLKRIREHRLRVPGGVAGGIERVELGVSQSLDEPGPLLLGARFVGDGFDLDDVYLRLDKDDAIFLHEAGRHLLQKHPDKWAHVKQLLDHVRQVAHRARRYATVADIADGTPLGMDAPAPGGDELIRAWALNAPLDEIVRTLGKIDVERLRRSIRDQAAEEELAELYGPLIDELRGRNVEAGFSALGGGIAGLLIELPEEWYVLITHDTDGGLNQERDLDRDVWQVGVYPGDDAPHVLRYGPGISDTVFAEQLAPLIHRLGHSLTGQP